MVLTEIFLAQKGLACVSIGLAHIPHYPMKVVLMNIRSLIFTMIFLLSAVAAHASEGLNSQVKNCASLLPQGKKYQVSVVYDIDNTAETPSVTGSFSIDWSPGYMPTKQEEEKAFKELEPFIMCVGPILAGASDNVEG